MRWSPSILLLALAGCWATPPRRSQDAAAAPQAADGTPGPRQPGPQRVGVEAVVALEDLEGAAPARARAALVEAARSAPECAPGSTGAIRVRVVQEGGRTRLAVEPGTSLDPRAQQCVLDTLSRADLDDVSSRASASERGHGGFSALLRIEW